MNNLKRILTATMLIIALSLPAAAKFSIGPRIGLAVNDLKFSEDIFSADNRAGFTGGLQIEYTAPVLNLGFDASVMYVRRTADINMKDVPTGDMSKDWIEIPVNLKYKIGLPVVGNIITPYIFTGPSIAFLTSSKAISAVWESAKFDVSWNIGAGVQLFSHLQIGASYGFGMTKLAKSLVNDITPADINGRNRYWTITAAWLF